MKKIYTLIAAIAITGFAMAQSPKKMSYQSVIRNSGGNIVANSNVTVKVSILQGSIVGSASYVETHSKSTNANGLVTLEIGTGSIVSGQFDTINWPKGPYFIKTETDPTGGTSFTITGISQLMTVPYAFYAETSGTTTGAAGGDLIGNYPNPQIALPLTKTDSFDANSMLYLTNSSSVGSLAVIKGQNSSKASSAIAVQGIISSTTPGGFSSAIRGQNNGTGGLGVGVYGSQAGSGWGVYGTAPSGIGVYGSSTSGFGVYGQSTTGVSVYGIQPGNGTNSAGYFQNTNAANAASTLFTTTNGAAPALSASTTGTSNVAQLNISNAANTAIALDVSGNGSGSIISALSTGTGVAGSYAINNSASTSNAIEATTNGSGIGILGSSTATTGSTTGVKGTVTSTANGIGATGGVSGIVGLVSPTSPGGYSAGVRGINNGTGGTGIGVIGYQAGSGWGVYGETPKGFGVYGLTTDATAVASGVRGETFSTNGIGVQAKYSGSGVGTALEVGNGGIKVTGTNKAAFTHTATAANKLSANGTDVDNPMCNGDANCLLFVTQRLGSGVVYNNSPIGVYYNSSRSKWEIFNQNNVAIPTGAIFHVLVIKQ